MHCLRSMFEFVNARINSGTAGRALAANRFNPSAAPQRIEWMCYRYTQAGRHISAS